MSLRTLVENAITYIPKLKAELKAAIDYNTSLFAQNQSHEKETRRLKGLVGSLEQHNKTLSQRALELEIQNTKLQTELRGIDYAIDAIQKDSKVAAIHPILGDGYIQCEGITFSGGYIYTIREGHFFSRDFGERLTDLRKRASLSVGWELVERRVE